jgi:uncharacterized membrane protein YeaQ/YmgE (transglycosylase-associated protein family)
MEEQEALGWFMTIVIGGFAGWLAERFMKSDHGVLVNIILGIVGAVLARFLLGMIGVAFGGTLGYLVAGFLGACLLIWIGRKLR